MKTSREAPATSGRRAWWALAGFAAAVFVAAAIGALGVQGWCGAGSASPPR
ncbi:hypothetical protein [Micromonospora tarensis]|uniref:hypothetical protein n=1 Tax=Micromonospora tarensis TaxID=2806100 RepID=UPI001EE435C1|nr:hypothetical protein [Micromonospora tarensis]